MCTADRNNNSAITIQTNHKQCKRIATVWIREGHYGCSLTCRILLQQSCFERRTRKQNSWCESRTPTLTSPQAVCCADGSHCCPNHYKCDEHKTSCIKGEVVIPWYTKLPATTSVQVHAAAKYRDVPCDGKTSCKDGETCCKMSAAKWGCCPIPNVWFIVMTSAFTAIVAIWWNICFLPSDWNR